MDLGTPDLIVLIVGGIFALRGAFKGFAWQAVRTLGLIAAFWSANLFHERLSEWLDDHLGLLPDIAWTWIAWLAIAIGVFLIVGLFAYMARGVMRTANLTAVDRVLGCVLGAAMGFLLCTLGFALWGSFQSDESLKETFEGSHTVRYMARAVDVVKPLAPAPIRKRWMHVLGALDDAVGDKASP